MFIAHLPAGYLCGKHLLKRASSLPATPRQIMLCCLAGAITPDLDLLYFYLLDQRQHHHHTYITHWPILWLTLILSSLLAIRLCERKTVPTLVLLFSLSGLLHLLLDSVVGDIWWLAPWIDHPFALFQVSPDFKPWWLNFLLHWSFMIELAITFRALTLWLHRDER